MVSTAQRTTLAPLTPIRRIFIVMLMFFPLVEIGGFPVALPLLLLPFCYRYELPTQYLFAGVLGSGIVGLMTASNIYTADTIVAKDLFYWTLPLFYPLFIALGMAFLNGSGNDHHRVHIVIKTALVVQLVAIGVQLLNPLGVINLLEPYFQALAVNVGANAHHGTTKVLQRRPGGTVGISTRLGFVVYLLGRFLTTYTRRYRYVIWAALLALLASARMALVTIVVTEAIVLGLPILRSRMPEIRIRTLAIAGVPTVVAGIALVAIHPFLSRFLEAALSGNLVTTIVSTRSVQHRADAYSYLFDNPESIFIGGLVVSNFHTFAYDSELVLRTLQFGLAGYLAFKLPLIACWLRGIQLGDPQMRRLGAVLLIVSILSSLTTTTSSNMYFILLFSVLIAAGELSRR